MSRDAGGAGGDTAWIPCEVGTQDQVRRVPWGRAASEGPPSQEGGCLPASAPRRAPASGWGCAGDVSQGL